MGQTINPFGKKIIKLTATFCGRELSLETGRVGFRSSSSVIARYGDTVVLGTVMVDEKPAEGFDYFPLSIDYEEKMYAAGKISGSRFIKREGRPSDDAVLIGRLIDRPIRPLWPKGYRHQVQGIATVLSMDPEFRPDAIAMIAMSSAFMLSGAPFEGPVAGLRIGMKEGKYKPFASPGELKDGPLDLMAAGVSNGIMMVEAGANEASEDQVVGALEFALKEMQPALKLQNELVEKVKVEKQRYTLSLPDKTIQQEVESWLEGRLGKNLRAPYPERNQVVRDLRSQMDERFAEKVGEDTYRELKSEYHEAFMLAIHSDVRKEITEFNVRPDGRAMDELRPLSSETGFLPRAHGSSIFTRGVTQALNVVTLAPLSYAQVIDTMEKDGERRYIHHYNAPGWTVGEVKRLMGPGRREIGHGFLAEKALLPVIPDEDEFPYTIRSVTEIMSQNGSTSMAAACSSCLALMDAGVPLKAPVSGIAMGLMLGEDDKPFILSDIADAEDFAGDMDFKVAGTNSGITALQMDMKVHGLGIDILKQVLSRAKKGRAQILKHILDTLPKPKAGLSEHAPRVESIKIDPEKIREVIGKGGEMINKIIAETGAEIDIKDDGTVFLASPDKKSIDGAKQFIQTITAEPEVGKIYEDCRVVSVLEFGAFVEILPGKEGLVHISEMSEERVKDVADVVKEGDKVTVKLVAIDDRGRLQLSMKAAARESRDKDGQK